MAPPRSTRGTKLRKGLPWMGRLGEGGGGGVTAGEGGA